MGKKQWSNAKDAALLWQYDPRKPQNTQVKYNRPSTPVTPPVKRQQVRVVPSVPLGRTPQKPQKPLLPQNSQPSYIPTREQQWIINQRKLQDEKLYQRQKDWFYLYNQTANKAQQDTFKFQQGMTEAQLQNNLKVTQTQGTTSLNVAKEQGKTSLGVADIESKTALNVAKTQGETSRGVAEIQGNTSRDVAKIEGNTSRNVAELNLQGVLETSRNNLTASKYSTDAINKQTEANYFTEREKNAIQKEKNKQDLWLNAGLGILDSINKQRASSSQAAAQIYSSFLSNNPYNFKYWN